MRYRILGRTGVKVSSLCCGTLAFGSEADEAASAAMFKACLDAGVNFFDTANAYGPARSEEVLGRLMLGMRDDLVITSKVCAPMGPGVNDRGLSRRHIVAQAEGSLRRLQTDRLDVYFVHFFDAATPIEETLRGLEDLTRAGKILYPGVSNWSAWQIAKALGIAERRSWSRFECIQPMYSLLKRQVEVEILPLAQAEQIGVISYSPLAAGLLTGKYSGGKQPETGRLVGNPGYARRYGDQMYAEITARFLAYAKEKGIHPATLTVAWAMSHPGITAPIIGARHVDQLRPSLAAAEVEMDAAWRAEVSALSFTPPPATDRSEEAQPA